MEVLVKSDYIALNQVSGAVLSFLDDEYQKKNNLTLYEINEYSKLSIILFNKSIASPAFFIESPLTQQSIWLSPLFKSHDVLQTRNTDPTIESYLERRKEYHSNLNYRNSRLTDSILSSTKFKGYKSQTNITESIRSGWNSYNMKDNVFFNDSFENNDLLSCLKHIPDAIDGNIFTPDKINAMIKSYYPRWAKDRIITNYTEKLILKLYFSALCEKNDVLITCNMPFSSIINPQENLYLPNRHKTKIINVSSLLSFLQKSELYSLVSRMNVASIIHLSKTRECLEFREVSIIDSNNKLQCIDTAIEKKLIEKAQNILSERTQVGVYATNIEPITKSKKLQFHCYTLKILKATHFDKAYESVAKNLWLLFFGVVILYFVSIISPKIDKNLLCEKKLLYFKMWCGKE